MRKLVSILALCVLAGCATSQSRETGESSDASVALAEAGSGEADNSGTDALEDDLLADLEGEFTNEATGTDEKGMRDPFRAWNTAWFHFNDKLYFWFLRPVSKGYGRVMPEPVRKGTNNFFTNLKSPVPLTSCLLQGRWNDAGTVASRFGINTTAGVLGWLDVAENRCDIPGPEEDIDQAFGAWGIASGPYLVWPVFGPSSVRGTFGLVGDHFLTPTTWLSWSWPHKAALSVGKTINKTSLDPDQYADLRQMTVEPYTAMRNAYFQNRKKVIAE